LIKSDCEDLNNNVSKVSNAVLLDLLFIKKSFHIIIKEWFPKDHVTLKTGVMIYPS